MDAVLILSASYRRAEQLLFFFLRVCVCLCDCSHLENRKKLTDHKLH